jgi:hypothetical protein
LKIDKSVDDLHRRLDEMKPNESVEEDDYDDSIAIEARFAMLRDAHVMNYEKKYREMWDKGIINDNNFLNFTCPGLDSSYWQFTQEEKDYYEKKNKERSYLLNTKNKSMDKISCIFHTAIWAKQ